MQSLLKEANTRLVVLTTDSPQQNRGIAESLGLTMRILSDSKGKILRKLGLWDTRWSIAAYGYYLLDPGLRVISRQRGYWEADEENLRAVLGEIPSPAARGS